MILNGKKVKVARVGEGTVDHVCSCCVFSDRDCGEAVHICCELDSENLKFDHYFIEETDDND